MRNVEITVRVPGVAAGQTFERLCEFERYPELTDAVRSVTVVPCVGRPPLSQWEVTFRKAILRWTEQDLIDRERRTIAFRLVDGDFDSFTGGWSVDGDDASCVIAFRASFDLGMPTLADMLDPLAESALRESIVQIVAGLVGRPIEVLPSTTQSQAVGGLRAVR